MVFFQNSLGLLLKYSSRPFSTSFTDLNFLLRRKEQMIVQWRKVWRVWSVIKHPNQTLDVSFAPLKKRAASRYRGETRCHVCSPL